jgi:hypothetical protein
LAIDRSFSPRTCFLLSFFVLSRKLFCICYFLSLFRFATSLYFISRRGRSLGKN